MLPLPDMFHWQDKLIHAAAYALMALIFWMAGKRAGMQLSLLVWSGVVFCAFYGASDEWHQSFVPGRDASPFDWLADTLGAFLLTLTLCRREVKVSGRE